MWGNKRQVIIDNSGLPSGEGVQDIRVVIANVIRFILGFLGILAVIIVLIAGFKWMTAGGNEENVSGAKKMLIAGLIGLVIIIFAYALANFVINSIYNAVSGSPIVG